MLKVRDKIHSDIPLQFPDFYRAEESPLVDFVQAYYEWLDGTLDRNIPKIGDIDETYEKFLLAYKEKYLKDFPISQEVDIRFLVKHINDLYKRKGSEDGLRLLFRMFFNEEIEVFYPSTAVLKPSDSQWSSSIYLEMLPVSDYRNYPIEKGDILSGDVSGAKGFVDEVVFVKFSGIFTPIVYISNLDGSFISDDAITRFREGFFTAVGRIIRGSTTSASVLNRNRVSDVKVGEEVKLVSQINGVGATALVSKVGDASTGQINYVLDESGYGYILSGPPNYVNRIIQSDQFFRLESGSTVNARLDDAVFAVNSFIQPISNRVFAGGVSIEFDSESTSVVSTTNNTIVSVDHGFVTGMAVLYTANIAEGGIEIGGLQNAKTYYVIVVDSQTIRLATSYENAVDPSPTAISITSVGTGTAHKLQTLVAYYADPQNPATRLTEVSGVASIISLEGDLVYVKTVEADASGSSDLSFSGDTVTSVTTDLSVFKTGYRITVDGTLGNDGVYTVAGTPTATSLQITGTFNTEIISSGVIRHEFPDLPDNGKAELTFFVDELIGADISFSDSTISSISTDLRVYQAGDIINVSGSSLNDGEYTITGTPTATSLDVVGSLTNESVNNTITLNKILKEFAVSIAPQNSSASFEPVIDSTETVSIISDFIGEFISVPLAKGVRGTDITTTSTTITTASTDVSLFEAGEELYILDNTNDVEYGPFTVTGTSTATSVSVTTTLPSLAPPDDIIVYTNDDVDYGMSGAGTETLDTSLRDAFTIVELEIGAIDSLFVTGAGFNYQNDIRAVIVQEDIATFDKRDVGVTFSTIGFNLVEGDILQQSILIENVSYNPDFNFSGNTITTTNIDLSVFTLGQTITITDTEFNDGTYTISSTPTSTTITVSGLGFTDEFNAPGTISVNLGPSVTSEEKFVDYTAKGRFLRKVGNTYFFRQVSFYGFDENRPVLINGRSYNIANVQRDLTSEPMGRNAFIVGNSEFQTGQIEAITIKNSGYRYTDDETVDLYRTSDADNKSRLAQAKVAVNGVGKGQGSWKTKTSFLNENTRAIHDNFYYQEYSYDVSASVPPRLYENLIKETMEVAGTKLFTTPLINTFNNTPTSLDAEIKTYDVTLEPLIALFDPNDDGNLIEQDLITELSGDNLVAVVVSFDQTVST